MKKSFSLDELRAYLQKNRDKKTTLEALSDYFDCGVTRIQEAVKQLHSDGFNVVMSDDQITLSKDLQLPTKPLIVDIGELDNGKVFRFAACGDMHLGSKYERLDALRAFYKILEKEGITTVYLTGNMIDGEARFNKYDIHTVGVDGQCKYFIDNYPQHKGITTYYITGDDHEGWYTQREGIDVGKYLERMAKDNGRGDLVYIGHMERDIHLKASHGKTVIRLVHPGGGTAYAISYTMQKLIESYQGGEKPHIVLAGHYHKAEYIFLRNVHVIQTACFQDQTPFMRKKKIPAHVGGWIIEFTQSSRGTILDFRTRYIPFLNKESYSKGGKWSYKWV